MAAKASSFIGMTFPTAGLSRGCWIVKLRGRKRSRLQRPRGTVPKLADARGFRTTYAGPIKQPQRLPSRSRQPWRFSSGPRLWEARTGSSEPTPADRHRSGGLGGARCGRAAAVAVTDPGKLAQIAYGLLPRDVFISVEQRTPGNLDPDEWAILRRVIDLIQQNAQGAELGPVLETIANALRADQAKMIEAE